MKKRGLIGQTIDHTAKGVSIESLKKSRAVRKDFSLRYGGVPTSILVHDRTDKALDLIRDGLENGGKRAYKDQEMPVDDKGQSGFHLQTVGVRKKDKEGRSYERCRFETGDPLLDNNTNFYLRNRSVRKGKTYKNGQKRSYGSGDFDTGNADLDKTGFGARGHFVRQSSGVRQDPEAVAPLSSFFQNIGRLMVDFYCPEGGIVYDPFAGHNSRMQLVYECKRHYIGVDISKEFMHANEVIRNHLLKMNSRGLFKNTSTIKLILGDSSSVPEVENESCDFTITSPPYWSLEYYGDEPEQLGNAPTYEKFIELLKRHVEENYRVLKSGAFCAWFINDFRIDKKFYPFHMDLYRSFIEVGFEPFNIYIVDLGNPIAQAFVQFIISSKIFPKRHEYCLLFKKST